MRKYKCPLCVDEYNLIDPKESLHNTYTLKELEYHLLVGINHSASQFAKFVIDTAEDFDNNYVVDEK